ncbi:J domain-containing protein [Dyella nitratireducens]|uniref:J domain-containing protein n=1 Tax=Dyella nitratireducens TaxID=1849580 RepID=A0ABQ1G493_9GAMM|nr:J domain-containing protein [Dyella nitratireducens]GGA37106.1 hypothetical protein GCM10010981_27780 [Dyella nitratireducens]GLQ41155.1 hypothetical protein GCM10007902_10050 [Dyella nitratireducens]
MNWAYALLGIPADADATTIKRAYARLLRTTRPDEDAAAFQRLNTAYQLALSQAGNRSTAPAATSAVVAPAREPVSTSAPTASAHPIAAPPQPPKPSIPAPLEVLKPSTPSAPAPGTRPLETLRRSETSKPVPAPSPLEVLKPSAPPTAPAPRSLETLRPSGTAKPTPAPAPLEVLKPAAHNTKPATRQVEVLRPPAPKPAPQINAKQLAERVIREASHAENPQTLSHWLDRCPELWSFQVKQAIGQLMLQHLLREPQPMASANLDVLLRFFDLDHVLSGVNPVTLEQLRNKQAMHWEVLNDQASLARRARIFQNGRPHTLRVRECINLLKQPPRWRPTFVTALTRDKPLHLARLVYTLCNGNIEQLPSVIDREHARFWFRAAGASGIHRERIAINAIRAFTIALACAMGITALTTLLSLQNGDSPSHIWGGGSRVFFALFGGILLIWAIFVGAALIDQWQGQPETTASRKPWLRRLFIPVLSALGLGLDYLGGAPIAASVIVWSLMILSVRRLTHRQPKRPKKPAFNFSPRAIAYLLLVGAVGVGNLVQQIPGGAFDGIPLLGVVSGVTLLVWGIDMWRHRAHLHPKLARS